MGLKSCVLFFRTQIKRNQIRKGMVLVDPVLKPVACWEFEGDILVLHHPTTISAKYQAMGKGRGGEGGREKEGEGGRPERERREAAYMHRSENIARGRVDPPNRGHGILVRNHEVISLTHSPLWEHPTDCIHHVHEPRPPEDWGQGLLQVPLHQEPRVHPTRHPHGVQGGTHEGRGQRHQDPPVHPWHLLAISQAEVVPPPPRGGAWAWQGKKRAWQEVYICRDHWYRDCRDH